MSLKMKLCLCLGVLFGILLPGCTQGGGVVVPIMVENADHLTGIGFTLLYDTTVFEVSKVDMTDLTKRGSTNWAVTEPGKLAVVVAGVDISGDAAIAKVTCRVPEGTGLSKLTIEVEEAVKIGGELLETEVSEGSLSAADKAVEPPVVVFIS